MRFRMWGTLMLLVVCVTLFAQGCKVVRTKTLDKMEDETAALTRATNRHLNQIRDLVGDNADLAKERDALLAELDEENDLVDTPKKILVSFDEMFRQLQDQGEGVTERFMNLGPGIEVTREPGIGIKVTVAGDVLFDSGKAEIKTEGQATLRKVVPMLKGSGEQIRISGHTDSDRISASSWEDNLQLSGERARAVLKYLATQGVPEKRMHFAGYGSHFLKRDASGKENKAKSRRAEILILSPLFEIDKLLPPAIPE